MRDHPMHGSAGQNRHANLTEKITITATIKDDESWR